MSNSEDMKELLDRSRRTETRLITLAEALGVDLMGIVRQSQPEAYGDSIKIHTLDVPVARIRKVVREAWPGRVEPVAVYFEGRMVAAVTP